MTPGDNRLEPGTVADSDDGHCLHSIAISLKRIADALSGEGDLISTTNMIEQLAWSAGRSFEQGRRTDR